MVPPPTPLEDSFDWLSFGAVLFDLDGVITPTALVHERAWAMLFADYNYSEADYLASIDGKPRYEGVATFLASRNVELPWGSTDDPPEADTVCGFGNRKNNMFMEILNSEPLSPYPGTMRVLDLLDEAATPQAIVSSSRNARAVLAAAGLKDRFPVVVDGMTAADEALAGKPEPAMFHRGAELLDVDHSRCLVVEDAVAGVQAGAAGGFQFVLGVDRGGNLDALRSAGADLVVGDLADTLTS